MNYKKITDSIKKNEIKNVYLFYGEETYLIDDILRRLKKKLVNPDFEQLNFILIGGKEASYEKIIDACETLPFMAEKKLVYLNGLDIFKKKSGSSPEEEEEQSTKYITEMPKNDEERFANYIAKIPESTVVVFYGNPSVDGRRKIVKQIKKYGCAAEFTKLSEEKFNRWIKWIFGTLGKSIGARELVLFKNNLDYLGKRSSQNLLDVENEIKKLVSFMGESINVEKDHIDKAMGSNFHNDIFNLLDSIEKNNYPESVKRLNHMLEKKEPALKILAVLGNQIKNILSSKLLTEEGYSYKEIASKLEIHDFVARKCVTQGRRLTIERLRELLNLFLDADMAIKSSKMDETLIMEMLILKTCQQ